MDRVEIECINTDYEGPQGVPGIWEALTISMAFQRPHF